MNNSPVWPLLTPYSKSNQDKYCAVTAKGIHVSFADGSTKLCGRSGLWNTNLGYGNEAVAEAAKDALLEASYLPVWGFDNKYARDAGNELIRLTNSQYFSRVLFSTSGGAANDAAMKLSRHYQHLKKHKGKDIILGLKGGYHGLTFGSFALSDVSLGKKIYGVDQRRIGHIKPNCTDDLIKILNNIGDSIAAIFVEPVIGNGAVVLQESFISALFSGRKKYGYLIVCDEVATGFGRTGASIFASTNWPENPDVIVTAKGMTNGTQAASALIIADDICNTYDEANALLAHAETQAGTPIVCASILSTVSEFNRLDILNKSKYLSNYLDGALNVFVQESEFIGSVSGQGCMRSINFDSSNLDPIQIDTIIDEIFAAGAMVHPGPNSLLLMPALTYTNQQIDDLLDKVASGIQAVLPSRHHE